MTRDIAKAATYRDLPGKEFWVKFQIDESKRIVGLGRNYIWTFKHEGNKSGYDTFDGLVISAPDFDSAWEQFFPAARFDDDEYDLKTPWIVQIVGIDLTDDGNRVIESSFVRA